MDRVDKIGLSVGAIVISALFGSVIWSTFSGPPPNGAVVARIDFGQTLEIEVVPTAFNESPKVRIVCERGTAIAPGMHTIVKGKRAELVRFQSGNQYLSIEGEPTMIRVY